MSDDNRIVWSDQKGDLRKNKASKQVVVNEKEIEIHLKRVTSGKGRTAIILSNLPNNKKWCQRLAKNIKKNIGAGGTYKDCHIEVHGEQIDKITDFLNKSSLAWKKIGG